MKILHLINHAREIGNGIVNAALDLVCSQAGAGHDFHCGSSGGEFESLLALSSQIPQGVESGLDRFRGPALASRTDAIYRAALEARR